MLFRSDRALAAEIPTVDSIYDFVNSPDVDPTSKTFEAEPNFSGEQKTMVEMVATTLLSEMARDQRVIASLFDRLTDTEPRLSREIAPPTSDQLREYKNAVARDLTNLLNTRRSEGDISEVFELTRGSVAAYGVEDFSAAPMDRETIRTAIERAIRLFDSRLTRVQVTLDNHTSNDFQFSYHITGMLRVGVGLEPVVYDAELPAESRRFRVAANR